MAVDCLKSYHAFQLKGDTKVPLTVGSDAPVILIAFIEGEKKHYLINSC